MIFDVIKKAKQLFYDNKNSGLDVNNVQDAIDDLTQAIVEVDAINEGTGSPILLTDTLDDSVLDFKAYGKSVQDGTPTPESPVDIVSVGDSGSVEIKSTGKNLIPYPYYDGTSKTANGVTTTIDENGWAHIKGTPSASTDCFNFTFRNTEFPAGTYTISGVPDGASSTTYRAWLGIYKSGTTTSIKSLQVYSDGVTFTVDEPFTMIFRATAVAGATVDVIYKPMLRRAEVTDGTYEIHKSSSISIPLSEPLRSVGEVKDEIACIDGVYGVIRRIASKVFKGDTSEKWNKHTTQNNVYYRLFADSLDGSKSIWSHFTDKVVWPPTLGTKLDNTQNGLKYAYLEVDTLAEWNEWLKANPVTIEYILEEEVFEPFDNQALFDNIVTYDNVTYLTSTDNAEMWVEYYSNSSVGQRLAKTDEQMRAIQIELDNMIPTTTGTDAVFCKSGNVVVLHLNGVTTRIDNKSRCVLDISIDTFAQFPPVYVSATKPTQYPVIFRDSETNAVSTAVAKIIQDNGIYYVQILPIMSGTLADNADGTVNGTITYLTDRSI